MVTFTTALMTGLSGAMASVLLLVMTVVFMLFEVRHVPYKMRFALNNPQIHIAGLHRAIKGVSHYLALKDATQFMDRCHRLAGAGADGGAVCADVGSTGVFA